MSQPAWRVMAQSIGVSQSRKGGLPDPGPAADDVPVSKSLVAAIEAAGWPVTGSVVQMRWLRLAACHSSYLYENTSTPISSPVLPALGSVGSNWLLLAVVDHVVDRSRPALLGPQNRMITVMHRGIAERLEDLLTVTVSMRLGKGEELTRGSGSRVSGHVLTQILGVIAFFDGYAAIKCLVGEVYNEVLRNSARLLDDTDWWNELARQIPAAQLTLVERNAGSDHEPIHVAEIGDRRGRKGRGEHRKKGLAKNLAAQDFLRRAGLAPPERADGPAIQRLRGRPQLYPAPLPVHQNTLNRLSGHLGIRPEYRPDLQQALTHRSWAYENSQLVRKANQQDYGLLANHGSHVINAVAARSFVRAVLQRTLEPTADEASVRSLPTWSYTAFFDELLPESAVLRGRGQRECPPEMKSDAVQAVAAVIWRQNGERAEFRLPEEFQKWIARESMVQTLDDLSRLQRICSIFGAEMTVKHSGTGPDHKRLYSARLDARFGDVLLSQIGPESSGKKETARVAAGQVLRVLRVSGAEPPSSGDREQSAQVLQYMARRLSDLTGRNVRRCVNEGLLGVDLVAAPDGDLDEFMLWASEADSLAGPLDEDVFASLCSAYRNISTTAARPRLEQALQDLTSWVREIDPEGDVSIRSASRWESLLVVAGALRAATASQSVTVTEFAARWQAATAGQASDRELSATDAGALEECLTRIERAIGTGDGLTVTVRQPEDGVQIVCATSAAGVAEQVRSLADLLAELVPSVQIFISERGMTMNAPYAVDPEERSFAAAGLLASRSPYDLDSLGFLANVLHRLKNELIGLEDMARRAQSSDRRGRLQRLADAVRHHESACHLAEHLGRTRHAIADADADTVQLGRWLDEYCAEKTLELRSELKLVSPAAAERCEVTISPSILRDVLDNLVKNATEAMPDGGRIVVDWYTEPGHAFVVVHDDGPGLPDAVREAFQRDETLPSSKEGGSGLGLWLVRNALRRMNARIFDAPDSVGQRWVIELPREQDKLDAAEQSERAERRPEAPTVPARRRPVRILLADDQPNVAQSMAQHLEPAKVDITHDGDGALEMLRSGHYDVLVTDLQMPPGSWGGLELLRQMRAQGHRVPAIVLSSEGGQAQTIEALNNGAARYVTKDRAADELAAAVRSVVDEARQQARADFQNLPLPLARGLQRFQAEPDPNVRIRFGYQALEDSLRFIGAVGLGEHLHEDPEADTPSQVLQSNMSLGNWSSLIRFLGDALPLASYVGQVARSVDYGNVEATVKGRNTVGHTSSEPRNDDVHRMLDDVDVLLEQFAICLRHIVDRQVLIAQGLDYDGQRFRVSTLQLIGTGPVLPSSQLVTTLPVPSESVGLHHLGTESWVSLGPWLVSVPGETRGEWQVAVFDGVIRPTGRQPARIHYRTFGTSDRQTKPVNDADALIFRTLSRGR